MLTRGFVRGIFNWLGADSSGQDSLNLSQFTWHRRLACALSNECCNLLVSLEAQASRLCHVIFFYRLALTRRNWLSLMFPMNCDCSFCAHSSPQTWMVPSRLAISSSQAQR